MGTFHFLFHSKFLMRQVAQRRLKLEMLKIPFVCEFVRTAKLHVKWCYCGSLVWIYEGKRKKRERERGRRIILRPPEGCWLRNDTWVCCSAYLHFAHTHAQVYTAIHTAIHCSRWYAFYCVSCLLCPFTPTHVFARRVSCSDSYVHQKSDENLS